MLALSEKLAATSWILSRVTVSISNGTNHYSTKASCKLAYIPLPNSKNKFWEYLNEKVEVSLNMC